LESGVVEYHFGKLIDHVHGPAQRSKPSVVVTPDR
jgi:hypothetical protein